MSADRADAVRAFVALLLEPAVLAQLADLQRLLQGEIGRSLMRWARPEQLHLTLKFLGNVPAADLSGLVEVIQRACHGRRGFQLVLDGLSAFPSLQRPRILWVGLTGDVGQLMDLQKAIDQGTAGLGDHAEERLFHPHLTLGRIRSDVRDARPVAAAVERTPRTNPTGWMVREVHLMQSELSPGGARYTPLASVKML